MLEKEGGKARGITGSCELQLVEERREGSIESKSFPRSELQARLCVSGECPSFQTRQRFRDFQSQKKIGNNKKAMTQKPLLWLMSAWQMEASTIQYKEMRCQLNHVLASEQRTRQNTPELKERKPRNACPSGGPLACWRRPANKREELAFLTSVYSA